MSSDKPKAQPVILGHSPHSYVHITSLGTQGVQNFILEGQTKEILKLFYLFIFIFASSWGSFEHPRLKLTLLLVGTKSFRSQMSSSKVPKNVS